MTQKYTLRSWLPPPMRWHSEFQYGDGTNVLFCKGSQWERDVLCLTYWEMFLCQEPQACGEFVGKGQRGDSDGVIVWVFFTSRGWIKKGKGTRSLVAKARWNKVSSGSVWRKGEDSDHPDVEVPHWAESSRYKLLTFLRSRWSKNNNNKPC